MKHSHKAINKIWVHGDWVYGKFCEICGKELKQTKKEMLYDAMPNLDAEKLT